MGDGNSINVWEDPWLIDTQSPCIKTTMPQYLREAKVSSLMKVNGTGWDEELIDDIFEQEDRDNILNIPLPISGHKDKIIWSKEEKGVYSVKSCYRALIGEVRLDPSLKWPNIWKLSLPPKVKILVWQACRNILPTAINLRSRKVECSITCCLCNQDVESTDHIFLQCEVARACWNNFDGLDVNVDGSFEVWLGSTMAELSEYDMCLLLTTCWSIWGARNQKVWENTTPNHRTILSDAKTYLDAWRDLHCKTKAMNKVSRQESWKKPPEGMLKLNVDAAMDKDSKATGFGFVLRDSNGDFVHAMEMNWKGLYQPRLAEAIGIREALNWIKSLGVCNVQVESDASTVIDSIRSESDWTAYDLIIEDIRSLAKSFSNISFVFARRSANRADRKSVV